MICKFCYAEIDENSQVCPACGKDLAVKQVETFPEEIQESLLNASPVKPEEEKTPEETAPEVSQKKKGWIKGAIIAAASVLLLAAVGAILYFAGVFGGKEPVNYTVTDEEAVILSGEVVAHYDGQELTNGELQIYYWTQVYDFLNYNGTGYFDTTVPLSQQLMSEEDNITWQEYFLEMAIASWQRYQILTKLSETDEGYTVPTELMDYLEELPSRLPEAAAEYGFETATEFIQTDMGAGSTVEQYIRYMSAYCVGWEYLDYLYTLIDPTMEDIEKYYTENEEALIESGVTKDSGLIGNVRHILVELDTERAEGSISDGVMSTESTESPWIACREEARLILEEWENGEATEESFATMAQFYSDDPGSAETGGLYENITYKSNYVDSFRNWATDSERKPGDTDIITSDYGCHIMYFVSGEEYWVSTVRTNILADYVTGILNKEAEKEQMVVNYDMIALAEVLGKESA